MRLMRVAIAVMTHKGHEPKFSPCYAALLEHVIRLGPSYGVTEHSRAMPDFVSYPNVYRQKIFTTANHTGHTHLLMLDDDQTFPPDLLQCLLARNVQAIGANYVHKTPPHEPIAVGLDNKTRIDSRGKTGVEKIGHIGFGLFLLDLKVLDRVPAPHFEILWNEATQDYVGQDIYCCRKFRDHGIDIYVDHDLSQNVGHIGDYVYTLNSYK